MFNPFEYAITKENRYAPVTSKNRYDAPWLEFQSAGSLTLRLSLVFDTYETGEDVTQTTRELMRMMQASTREKGGQTAKVPPPRVAFEWGIFLFVAVITNLSQRFTLFKQDGTPVRAKVEVTFTQDRDTNDLPYQNPSSGGGDVERVWPVMAGDRLDTIAYEVYGDASKWRLIAEYNQIVAPLSLRAGQRLAIPAD
jgi:nucleoid-associated protein YgaU